jgi:hypothetical protein
MKDGYWVVRTYEAGQVGEKTKYFVLGDRTRRNRRKEESSIKKQEQNEYSTKKRLARLINANFTHGDILLGLDYSDASYKKLERSARKAAPDYDSLPEEDQLRCIREAAAQEMENYLRRVKRALEKEGRADELKYIAITSDMDGDTKETVRVHHHLIVPASCEHIVRMKWGRGGTYCKPLSKQEDYIPIAEYLIAQVRGTLNAKKFVSSRNLIRPQPKDRVAVSDAEIRVPRNCKLIQRAEYKRGAPQYIRYILPEKKAADISSSDGEPAAERSET